MLIILSTLKVQLMQNLAIVESMLRKLHDSSRKIKVDSREICIFSGTDQRKVLFKHTEIKKSTKGFIWKSYVVFHKYDLRSNS